MTKRKHSDSASISRSKWAKAQPSPSPSRTGYQKIQLDLPVPREDVETEGVASTEGDPTAKNPRTLSSELLSTIAQQMSSMDEDDSERILVAIHFALEGFLLENPPVPKDFATYKIFRRNVSHHEKDFLDIAKRAVRRKDWMEVVNHDVFWTVSPTDSSPGFLPEPEEMLVPRESSEQATELSWTAEFVNAAALKGLQCHVIREMDESNNYARFCSIVQSSGMGKSRLVDEFSKDHFLIPINLRESDSKGFPPTDDAVREFLTQFDSKDKNMQSKSYSRKDRIVKFREFMSEEQRFGEVGEKRKNFYTGVSQAQKAIDDRLEGPSKEELLGAFEALRGCVCDGTSLKGKQREAGVSKGFKGKRRQGDASKGKQQVADVFISFDEAYPLAIPWNRNSGLSNYIELRRALHLFSKASLFAFFLSTNGKISQFVLPRTRDPSYRILQGDFRTPRPFIELGFDQLMWNRKILDKYKTLEQVTSSECIAHMGRPLWGTMYDRGDNEVREHLLSFAIQKLLGSPIVSAETRHQRYAVLSQRLALDINTTAYISESPSPGDADATLEQIRNHMHVCVEIGEGIETIRGIAASEPILSEAASHVMREQFDLADAPQDVLSGFSIHSGDRGGLLVAAFFTWARDAVMLEQPLPRSEFCRHFSVEELFTCLFSDEIVQSIFDHTPSISPSKAKQRTFGEVANSANVHFNHFIQSQEQKLISRRYLIAFIARGAAVLGAQLSTGL
ncbi:hypothetical protein BJV78DRAFT_130947 [Lactifluus subvellereus]|nr:hypothetical protein BJV78DRAFT_130947 [Lactifluus subvellereus]